MLPLFDSHCHIDFTEFQHDRELVLTRAFKTGVRHLVVPGVTRKQSEAQLGLSTNSGIQLHFALGLHPYFLAHHQHDDFDILAQQAHKIRHQLVAIGECGIDASISDLESQYALFVRHIELANQLNLPLIVHHRQSHHHIARAFKDVEPKYGGVIHAFSGSYTQARYYIDKGFKLGIGGTITYPRANKTRQAIERVPISTLMLETDAPSMPLNGHQGERNEPALIVEVFNTLAAIKQVPTSVVAETIFNESLAFFGLQQK